MAGITLGLILTVVSVIGILSCLVGLLVTAILFKKQRTELLSSTTEGRKM